MKSFLFVKCIYFFINYKRIDWINVLLTLMPVSLNPIFDIGKVMKRWAGNKNIQVHFKKKITTFII